MSAGLGGRRAARRGNCSNTWCDAEPSARTIAHGADTAPQGEPCRPCADPIALDVFPWNERAISANERVGFVRGAEDELTFEDRTSRIFVRMTRRR
jgi:hypothetical protein